MLIAIALCAWLVITLFAIALMRAAARADAFPTEQPVDLEAYRLACEERRRQAAEALGSRTREGSSRSSRGRAPGPLASRTRASRASY